MSKVQRPSRWGMRLAAAVLAVSTMTGCSSFGGDDEAKASSSAPASNAVAGAGEAGLDLEHLPKPVASRTYKGTGTVKSIKVDLVQLRNRGKVTQVVFALTPEFETSKSLSVFAAFDDRSPNVAAIDLKGMMKYSSVRAGYSEMGSDANYTKLTDGTTTYFWRMIPTPKADKVDVEFHETMPAFENVTVPK